MQGKCQVHKQSSLEVSGSNVFWEDDRNGQSNFDADKETGNLMRQREAISSIATFRGDGLFNELSPRTKLPEWRDFYVHG